MKQKLTFMFMVAMLLSSFVLHAEEFTVDGIKYTGDKSTKTASVIGTAEGFDKTDVVIPKTVNGYTVTRIGRRAFAYATCTSFAMPNTVTRIDSMAFFRCANLERITVSNTLRTIKWKAFGECTSLKAIALPKTIAEIEGLTFSECSNIESIEIPETAPLETISSACFMECSKLTSFTIPLSVKTIEDGAFWSCPSLTSMYIPKTVTTLRYDGTNEYPPFYGCVGLTSIVVDKNNPVYDSRNNCNAIIETATNKLMTGCMNSTIPEGIVEIGSTSFMEIPLTTLEIPNTVTTIGDMAFMNSGLTSISIPASVTNPGLDIFNGCDNLVSASLPDSWESIPGSLFIFCRKLESVNIPSSVKSIEQMAFRRCESLKALDIPHSVETIGRQAFQGCISLESIIIPENVTTIESKAFGNCYGLKAVTSLISVPFEINEDVFQNVNVDENGNTTTTFSTALLYVPEGAKEAYKATAAWNKFACILEEGEEPEFNNHKLYTLTCKRGALVMNADGTGLAAGQTRTDAPEADKRFAIITYEGVRYLYSPTLKRFLLYNGGFVSHRGTPITFDDTHADGDYKYMLRIQNDAKETLYFNNNGNIVIDTWDTPDEGNRWKIEPVADFDPTEAMSLFYILTDAQYAAANEDIEDGRQYAIYTLNNGTELGTQCYYLTSQGYLTDEPTEAGIFTFHKTTGDGLFRSPGWKLDACFSNPQLSENGGASGDLNSQGHILTDMQNRDDWEGQVWYRDDNGYYAVRATNALSAEWGASTFWTVLDTDNNGQPEADYAWEPAFVWKLESDLNVGIGDEVKKKSGAGAVYDLSGQQRLSLQRGVNIVCTSDGRTKKVVAK